MMGTNFEDQNNLGQYDQRYEKEDSDEYQSIEIDQNLEGELMYQQNNNSSQGEMLNEEDEEDEELIMQDELDPIQLKLLIDDEDKCSKYIDGVIFNIEVSLEEEKQELLQRQTDFIDKEVLAYQIKRQIFLVKGYLQYCAILSQLGQHDVAKEIAKKGIYILQEVFSQCHKYVQEAIKHFAFQADYQASTQQQNIQENCSQVLQSQQLLQQTQYSKKTITDKKVVYEDNDQNPIKKYQVKEDIFFSKIIIENSLEVLSEIVSISKDIDFSSQKKQLEEASKSLYFWRNNPENNERHLRKELNAPKKNKHEEIRSVLGVSNGTEWIESFNIGSIMHMAPITYDDFSYFGDIVYELSQKVLLEKIIYISICYFTVATEIRFQELDKFKKTQAKEQKMKNNQPAQDQNNGENMEGTNNQNGNQKPQVSQQIETEEYKISELYHLKAIEIVCKHITCKSPYINHLVTSYHKHYNQNLDVIQEEESFMSNFSPEQQRNINKFNGQKTQQQNVYSQNQDILIQEFQDQEYDQFIPQNLNDNFSATFNQDVYNDNNNMMSIKQDFQQLQKNQLQQSHVHDAQNMQKINKKNKIISSQNGSSRNTKSKKNKKAISGNLNNNNILSPKNNIVEPKKEIEQPVINKQLQSFQHFKQQVGILKKQPSPSPRVQMFAKRQLDFDRSTKAVTSPKDQNDNQQEKSQSLQSKVNKRILSFRKSSPQNTFYNSQLKNTDEIHIQTKNNGVENNSEMLKRIHSDSNFSKISATTSINNSSHKVQHVSKTPNHMSTKLPKFRIPATSQAIEYINDDNDDLKQNQTLSSCENKLFDSNKPLSKNLSSENRTPQHTEHQNANSVSSRGLRPHSQNSQKENRIFKELKESLQKELNKNTWSIVRNLEKNACQNVTPKRNNSFIQYILQNQFSQNAYCTTDRYNKSDKIDNQQKNQTDRQLQTKVQNTHKNNILLQKQMQQNGCNPSLQVLLQPLTKENSSFIKKILQKSPQGELKELLKESEIQIENQENIDQQFNQQYTEIKYNNNGILGNNIQISKDDKLQNEQHEDEEEIL